MNDFELTVQDLYIVFTKLFIVTKYVSIFEQQNFTNVIKDI